MDLSIHRREGTHQKNRVKITVVISVLMLMLTTEGTDLDHRRQSEWRKTGNEVIICFSIPSES